MIRQSICCILTSLIFHGIQYLKLYLSACNTNQIDLALIIDHSSSIKTFDELRKFIKSFFDMLDVSQSTVRIGLITFDNTASTVFRLNTHQSTVSISFTNLYLSLYQQWSTHRARLQGCTLHTESAVLGFVILLLRTFYRGPEPRLPYLGPSQRGLLSFSQFLVLFQHLKSQIWKSQHFTVEPLCS